MRRGVALLFALPLAAVASDEPATERARGTTWDVATREVFDPAWIFPDTRADAASARRPTDLARRAVELAALRFPAPQGTRTDPSTSSFADLVAACRAFGADAKSRDAFLDRVRKARPDVWEACGPELLQLGRDEFLRSASWDPSKDHDRDGMLSAAPFSAAAFGVAPWTKIAVETPVQQSAAVFAADVDAILDGQGDYAAYPSDVGASYEFIHAVAGSFVKGTDPKGRPFRALRALSRSDLPFPYSTYDCDVRVLTRVGDDGLVRCDVYSTSPDFHWLAGQDVYVPLTTTDGGFAGMLVVRAYGFDIDDVPDGEGNVREALRASLGNLRRRAEKAWAASGSRPRTLRGTLPDFTVRGVKRAD